MTVVESTECVSLANYCDKFISLKKNASKLEINFVQIFFKYIQPTKP